MKKKRTKMLVLAAVVIGAVSAAAFLNATYNKRADKTVAIVDGEKLKLSDVDSRTAYVISELKDKYGENFEKELNKRIKNSDGDEKKKLEKDKKRLIDSRNDALESLVNIKVLSTKGKQLKLSADEDLKEIEELMANMKKNFIQSYIDEGMSKEEAEEKYTANKDKIMNEFYKGNGMNSENYTEALKDTIIAGKMENRIFDSITVSDDEIKKYYNDNINEYVKKAGYDVRELYFPIINGNKEDAGLAANDTFFQMADGNPNKSTDYDKTYKEAESKTHKLSSAGKIIAQTNTVAFENSNRPKVYMDCIKDLNVGGWCSPIPTDSGYYIPYVLNIRKSDEIRTLDDEKQNITYKLKSDKKEKELSDKLAEYKKEFDVKVYSDKLSF